MRLIRSHFTWKYYLLIILVGCIIYWPLTFNVFSLKNDALVYFLPYRYNISESIQNGHFPFWCPFIYTGLPLHSDIQSGVWNPFVLLISLFFKYNLTVLQYETLFYILVGGIGFFKLCKTLKFDDKVSLLLACSYLCSGFILDSASFTPWITSAAFLPFVFSYFIQFLKYDDLLLCIKFSLSLSLLFLSGYVSYFIITGYILFFIILTNFIQNKVFSDRLLLLAFLRKLITVVSVGLILCLPAIISYVDFFKYYQRGSGTSLAAAHFNPFSFANIISLLFPHASYKLQTANDITSRNIYFGIIPLLFLMYSFRYKLLAIQKTILLISTICFLISLGSVTPVRAMFYYGLPLMDSFRHPATVRIFTIIGMLLLSGYGMTHCFKSFHNKKSQALIFLVLVPFVAIILFLTITSSDSLMNFVTTLSFTPSNFKQFLDSSTLKDWLLIDSLIQLPFIGLWCFRVRRDNIAMFSICNLFLVSLFSLPFTTVSKFRVAEVNHYLASFSKNHSHESIWTKIQFPSSRLDKQTFGNQSFYSKKITLEKNIITPTINKSYLEFLGDSPKMQSIIGKKFAYSTTEKLELHDFSTNHFEFDIDTKVSTELHLIQQYNHNWKASVNDQAVSIQKDNGAFMKIPVPPGKHRIKFSYAPFLIIITSFIAISFFLMCLIFIAIKETRFHVRSKSSSLS